MKISDICAGMLRMTSKEQASQPDAQFWISREWEFFSLLWYSIILFFSHLINSLKTERPLYLIENIFDLKSKKEYNKYKRKSSMDIILQNGKKLS